MSGEETKRLGRWGEELVAEELQKQGGAILARGYHSRFGEIDLIAEKGGYLCFVEVKLRKNDSFAPARAFVDVHKQQKLRITAEIFLAEHPEIVLQPRFDVAEVYAPQGVKTQKPRIVYWENAF